ncbi:unnamed protein product [Rotaria sp. Silwood1]|nr:unnamed protein product [Rotaria sp. Silwood1]CAF4618508.1 unnamed protein product [Rotaria sp. Silwood1]
MKRIYYTYCLLLLCCIAKAQDPHFSQFFASPLTLNPAFTGKFNGNYRVAGNYRNQWPEINNAFVTGTASIDFHLFENRMKSGDMFGAGFMFLTDNSANSAVKMNYGSGSLAFHKTMDEDANKQFSIGLQGTYSNFLINTSKLVFEDQLTTLGFTGQSKELIAGQTLQTSYFDANAGLLFTSFNPENNSNYYLGLSMYHVNKPTINLSGTNFSLNPRYTLHAGGFYAFSDAVGLHLSGLHSSQGGTTETVVGGAFQLTASTDATNPIYVYAGSWLRLNDALIPYIGLEYSNTRLGVSYDVNTSSLKTASVSKGGIEVSLIFTNQPNTDRPINCPKF